MYAALQKEGLEFILKFEKSPRETVLQINALIPHWRPVHNALLHTCILCNSVIAIKAPLGWRHITALAICRLNLAWYTYKLADEEDVHNLQLTRAVRI